MANMPTFAIGTYEKIQPAIDSGILKYPSYVFVNDESGNYKNTLLFINKDLSIKPIEGYNQKDVIKCDSLPEIEEADEEKLYVCNNVVYEFTGDSFRPLFQDITNRLEAIEEILNKLQNTTTLFGTLETPLPETDAENRLYVDTETLEFGYYDKEKGKVQLGANNLVWVELQ